MSSTLEYQFSREWFKIVVDNPQIKWNWNYLCAHPLFLRQFVNEFPGLPYDEDNMGGPRLTLSKDSIYDPNGLTAGVLQLYLALGSVTDKRIWWKNSQHPALTVDILRENLKKPWDWKLVTANRAITIECIIANPDIPWDYSNLCFNPNLTLQNVRDKIFGLDIFNAIIFNDFANDKMKFMTEKSR